MKIVTDILIGLRDEQNRMAREHLERPNSSESLLHLNGLYRGLSYAIEHIEKTLRDEEDRQDNL